MCLCVCSVALRQTFSSEVLCVCFIKCSHSGHMMTELFITMLMVVPGLHEVNQPQILMVPLISQVIRGLITKHSFMVGWLNMGRLHHATQWGHIQSIQIHIRLALRGCIFILIMLCVLDIAIITKVWLILILI